jgi:DNA-binding transcriptional LysR family regulator
VSISDSKALSVDTFHCLSSKKSNINRLHMLKLTLDAIEIIDAIDRGGSFAAAADTLHKVPSTISYTVAKLEEQLGFQLFLRRGPRVTLTPAGSELLSEGRWLLRSAADLESRLRRIATGYEAELNLVHDSLLPTVALVEDIRAFEALGCGTRLRISTEVMTGSLGSAARRPRRPGAGGRRSALRFRAAGRAPARHRVRVLRCAKAPSGAHRPPADGGGFPRAYGDRGRRQRAPAAGAQHRSAVRTVAYHGVKHRGQDRVADRRPRLRLPAALSHRRRPDAARTGGARGRRGACQRTAVARLEARRGRRGAEMVAAALAILRRIGPRG